MRTQTTTFSIQNSTAHPLVPVPAAENAEKSAFDAAESAKSGGNGADLALAREISKERERGEFAELVSKMDRLEKIKKMVEKGCVLCLSFFL
jgi:hypothetical protein